MKVCPLLQSDRWRWQLPAPPDIRTSNRGNYIFSLKDTVHTISPTWRYNNKVWNVTVPRTSRTIENDREELLELEKRKMCTPEIDTFISFKMRMSGPQSGSVFILKSLKRDITFQQSGYMFVMTIRHVPFLMWHTISSVRQTRDHAKRRELPHNFSSLVSFCNYMSNANYPPRVWLYF